MSGQIAPYDPIPNGCMPAVVWMLMLASFVAGVITGWALA